jgi:hypothetical protein
MSCCRWSVGLAIDTLTLYDTPLAEDEARAGLLEIERELAELAGTARRGEAVELFQSRVIGIPEEVVAQLRHAPFRPGLEAIAHTLAYDAALLHHSPTPAQLAAIGGPTRVLDGDQSARKGNRTTSTRPRSRRRCASSSPVAFATGLGVATARGPNAATDGSDCLARPCWTV